MNTEIQPTDSDNQIVLYQPDDNIKLDVRICNDTVWLTRQQMATLFGRDVKTIGKHINNALREELAITVQAKNAQADSVVAKNAIVESGNPTVAKFAIVQNEGGRMVEREVEHYSLDMILSVGYRVHSPQGIVHTIAPQDTRPLPDHRQSGLSSWQQPQGHGSYPFSSHPHRLHPRRSTRKTEISPTFIAAIFPTIGIGS